jgi:hypothetical protein
MGRGSKIPGRLDFRAFLRFRCASREHLGRASVAQQFAGAIMAKRQPQITVPLNAALREFVERQAQQSDRSMAGQIRHVLTLAARQAEQQERAA